MKITLITHYYPPEVNAPAQRAAAHARYWVDAGHEVTIVTAQPSHPYGQLYDDYENETQVTTDQGIRLVRLKTILSANAGKFKRTLNYLSFMLAVRRNLKLIGPTDVVISTSPQFFCGLSGEFVKARHDVPWVFEIRDIWPESIIAVGAVKPNLATRILTGLARRAYRHADRIVSVSPGFSAHLRRSGVPDQKITLIPNGIRTDAEAVPTSLDEVPELAPLSGRFIAAYIGTFGMAHSAETILGAAKRLQHRKDIGFLLVGSGAERDRLFEMKAREQLDNVVLLDQQPPQRVAQLFSFADASIVHLKAQDVFRTVIPTKLLEGMAMRKPILLGVDGVARDILNSADGGLYFPPEDGAALAAAVETLADDPDRAARMGHSARRHVRENFDRSEMAARYLSVLTDLVSTRRV